MKVKKEFAILFFILAVLVFYIYSEKGEKTHYELPEIEQIQAEDISKITIGQKGAEIVITKDNDQWLVSDQKYRADKIIVETMVNDISGLKLSALASESKNYGMYELDAAKRMEVNAYKGDGLLRRIIIGKQASSLRHTFVMIDDDYRVFHGEGNLKNDFDKKVSDIRDKKVMQVSGEIEELVMKRGDVKLRIVRTEAPVTADMKGQQDTESKPAEAGPKWVTAEGKAVHDSGIDAIVATLSNLLCDEFIEKERKDDFVAPVFTAVMKGTNTYTISLFEKRDNQYPALSSESPYPFLISEWKANKIMKDFGSLLKEVK